MTEEEQKKELEIALTSYIALRYTQAECIGFIDGFNKALSLPTYSTKNFICKEIIRLLNKIIVYLNK